MSKKNKKQLTEQEVIQKYELNKTFLNKSEILIAGIDPSLTGTGVVIMNQTGKILFEKLILPKKLKGVERLQFIRNEVLNTLKLYNIDYVAIEGYSMNSKGRSVFDLGELGGVLRLTFYDNDIKYKVISPSSLKAFIAENGSADKEMMRSAVKMKYKIDINNDNICDAFGLGRMLLVLGDSIETFSQKGGAELLKKIRIDHNMNLF